jgi:hypothetical protein
MGDALSDQADHQGRHDDQKNMDGVLGWFQLGLTNRLMEHVNNLIQAAKVRSRGFRSTRYLTTMIYLTADKLDLNLPLRLATHMK